MSVQQNGRPDSGDLGHEVVHSPTHQILTAIRLIIAFLIAAIADDVSRWTWGESERRGIAGRLHRRDLLPDASHALVGLRARRCWRVGILLAALRMRHFKGQIPNQSIRSSSRPIPGRGGELMMLQTVYGFLGDSCEIFDAPTHHSDMSPAVATSRLYRFFGSAPMNKAVHKELSLALSFSAIINN